MPLGIWSGPLATAAVHRLADLPLASALQPPLTVIEQGPQWVGALAAERLSARPRRPGGDSQVRHALPVRLSARGSGEVRPSPLAPPA